MHETSLQTLLVCHSVIRVNLRSKFHLFKNLRLQSLAFNIRRNGCAHLSSRAVKDALYHGLARCAALCLIADLFVLMHVLLFPADECLVHFDFAIRTAQLGYGAES